MNEHLDRLIEQRMQRERWMAWRIRRYGYACLTHLEVEAMNHEVNAAHLSDLCSERGRLSYVASKMRISPSTASEHLSMAKRAMTYFNEHDIPAGWVWTAGFYRLNAPVQPVKFFRPRSYPKDQHNRAMMIVNNSETPLPVLV